MPDDLKPETSLPIDDAREGNDGLRLLSRSPHPYHRQNFELLDPSDQLAYRASSIPAHGSTNPRDQLLSVPSFTKESTPTSDSGTEADDEHFLKRLPAPKTRLHKGLRGQNEPLSGTATPLLSAAVLEEEGRKDFPALKQDVFDSDKRVSIERTRRQKELIRRSTEVCLLVALGGILHSNRDVRLSLGRWREEILAECLVLGSLLTLYPVRVILWAYVRGAPSRWLPIGFPSSFDPAALLYPPIIPLFVALLVAINVGGIVLPNLILSICSVPRQLVPSAQPLETLNAFHWLISCVPLFISEKAAPQGPLGLRSDCGISGETAVLLYPLHQVLCKVLHYLTTTSLLPAELELLSVGLINVALASLSPQMVILKALLWGGGLGLAIFCGQVIRWGISLARVPKWRFRRIQAPAKRASLWRTIISAIASRRARREILGTDHEDSSNDSGISSKDDETKTPLVCSPEAAYPTTRYERASVVAADSVPVSPVQTGHDIRFTFPDASAAGSPSRRHTLPSSGKPGTRSKTHTPSGRRKRSASSSVRAFFYLTQEQAAMRKWLYAGYVYACVLGIILVGIREYVKRVALFGNEPIGWALGYIFGDLPWFRFQVVKANLEGWICLPPRSGDLHAESCHLGWVQHLRHASFGEANTRLILSGYWMVVLVFGLAVVLQLSPIYEVDTRRKVFHFMMVAMFLPATYVDPAYAALALSLVLAIFLLLDLLRASQLPPLSKPIARFLAPYVDGRDHRGPVVISHIFLLIGCAIPLWLSLAALPRVGSGYLKGWEVPTRDVSMVSGIVCVGLGDAAASLIGRRWGRRKWLWGGGKSLEGSLAFTIAVFAGLMAGRIWLRIGGWPPTAGVGERGFPALRSWGTSIRDTGLCASMASLTEAVLTGGNDNVIVPVILWTCVKSLGI